MRFFPMSDSILLHSTIGSIKLKVLPRKNVYQKRPLHGNDGVIFILVGED